MHPCRLPSTVGACAVGAVAARKGSLTEGLLRLRQECWGPAAPRREGRSPDCHSGEGPGTRLSLRQKVCAGDPVFKTRGPVSGPHHSEKALRRGTLFFLAGRDLQGILLFISA